MLRQEQSRQQYHQQQPMPYPGMQFNPYYPPGAYMMPPGTTAPGMPGMPAQPAAAGPQAPEATQSAASFNMASMNAALPGHHGAHPGALPGHPGAPPGHPGAP